MDKDALIGTLENICYYGESFQGIANHVCEGTSLLMKFQNIGLEMVL